jgi:MarR family transcriptional regulator for hemolysin
MEFGELLKQFLIDLQSLFRTNTKSLNLTLPQIMLMSSIPTDGIDMTSLSHRIGVENSTLTRLIDVLIKNKLVLKNRNPLDGRSMLVSVTKSGEQLQKRIEAEVDRLGLDIFHHIPMEDQDEVKEILSTFHWIVTKYKMNK